MSKNVKRLETKLEMVVVVALVSTELFGGFVVPSVYAKTNTFTSEFETTAIPLCSTEPIVYGGTIHFNIKEEENGLGSAHVHYSNVHGVGFQTGTKYIVHQNEHDDVVLNKNGDTMFSTVMHGSVTGSGSIDNTRVDITFVNVVHPDGTVTVLVEDTKITCTG
jgi:hypothetical protein